MTSRKTTTPSTANKKNNRFDITPATGTSGARTALVTRTTEKNSDRKGKESKSLTTHEYGYKRNTSPPPSAKKTTLEEKYSRKETINGKRNDNTIDCKRQRLDYEQNNDIDVSDEENEFENTSDVDTGDVDNSRNNDEKSSDNTKVTNKIELRSYIGKSCLTQGEKSILISYFRKTFFKQLKFTHRKMKQSNSKEMMTIFKTIKIEKEKDLGKRSEKYDDIVKLLESCLTSKRNYVVERVRQKIKELMKADEMFNIDLIDKFRCNDFEHHSDKEKIKNAWYIFVYKLLPLVNEEWCKVLKDNHIQTKPNIYAYTSISDEVFTRWIIRCKYEKLLEEKQNNWPDKDADKRGKKGGPHESRVNINMYCSEFKDTQTTYSILPVREEEKLKAIQTKWNDLFWEEMVKKNPEKFAARPKKKRISDDEILDMPGMDDPWYD